MYNSDMSCAAPMYVSSCNGKLLYNTAHIISDVVHFHYVIVVDCLYAEQTHAQSLSPEAICYMPALASAYKSHILHGTLPQYFHYTIEEDCLYVEQTNGQSFSPEAMCYMLHTLPGMASNKVWHTQLLGVIQLRHKS